MGILDWIGMGAELAKPIEAVGTLYTTDKERLDYAAKLAEIEQKPGLAQLANNAIMAASSNRFENSWQALTGWTAGFCIALYYIPQLTIANFIWAQNCLEAHKVLEFPIDSSSIINLVYLLFGFGTYHLVKSKVMK